MVARLGPHSLSEVIKAAGTAPVVGRVGDEAVALGEAALLGFQDPRRVRFREREGEGEGGTGPELQGSYPPLGGDVDGTGASAGAVAGARGASWLRSPTIRIPLRVADHASAERRTAHSVLMETLWRQSYPAQLFGEEWCAVTVGEHATDSAASARFEMAFGHADGSADADDLFVPPLGIANVNSTKGGPSLSSSGASTDSTTAVARAPSAIQAPKRRRVNASGVGLPLPRSTRGRGR